VLGKTEDHCSHCILETESHWRHYIWRIIGVIMFGKQRIIVFGKNRIIGVIVFGESGGLFESLCPEEIEDHCVIEVGGSLMLLC